MEPPEADESARDDLRPEAASHDKSGTSGLRDFCSPLYMCKRNVSNKK